MEEEKYAVEIYEPYYTRWTEITSCETMQKAERYYDDISETRANRKNKYRLVFKTIVTEIIRAT